MLSCWFGFALLLRVRILKRVHRVNFQFHHHSVTTSITNVIHAIVHVSINY